MSDKNVVLRWSGKNGVKWSQALRLCFVTTEIPCGTRRKMKECGEGKCSKQTI